MAEDPGRHFALGEVRLEVSDQLVYLRRQGLAGRHGWWGFDSVGHECSWWQLLRRRARGCGFR